jgi:glucokinase
MKKFRIGVDIGGTNVKIALVDFDGKIIYSNTVPTRAEMGYEAGVNNIKQVNPNVQIMRVSAKTEEGLDNWINFLVEKTK